jgi:hypothetical protein
MEGSRRNWRIMPSRSLASEARFLSGFDGFFGALRVLVESCEIWPADSEISPEAEVCSVAAVAMR